MIEKEQLKINLMLFIPGILMLFTLFSPEFNNLTAWYTTTLARSIVVIFCLVVSGISLGLLIMKKYKPIEETDAHKRKIDKITNYIDDYLKNNAASYYSTINRDIIKEWVSINHKDD